MSAAPRIAAARAALGRVLPMGKQSKAAASNLAHDARARPTKANPAHRSRKTAPIKELLTRLEIKEC